MLPCRHAQRHPLEHAPTVHQRISLHRVSHVGVGRQKHIDAAISIKVAKGHIAHTTDLVLPLRKPLRGQVLKQRILPAKYPHPRGAVLLWRIGLRLKRHHQHLVDAVAVQILGVHVTDGVVGAAIPVVTERACAHCRPKERIALITAAGATAPASGQQSQSEQSSQGFHGRGLGWNDRVGSVLLSGPSAQQPICIDRKKQPLRTRLPVVVATSCRLNRLKHIEPGHFARLGRQLEIRPATPQARA